MKAGRTRLALVGAVVGVALLVSTCSGGGGPEASSPSASTPPGPPSASGPAWPPATGGTARIDPAGHPADARRTLQLIPVSKLRPGVLTSVPPGDLLYVWEAPVQPFATDLILISAPFVGVRKTSDDDPGPSILIFLGDGTGYSSKPGDCTVTVTSANASAIQGRFRCPALPGSKGEPPIKVSGTFSATA